MRKFILLAMTVMMLAAGVTVAQDDLSGVDPSGQNVIYWHQFSGAQLETMTALVNEFNSSNEWGVTVEALAQGNYTDIANLMSAAIISGELPNLVAGYQNNAASYHADGAVVDLNMYINDPTWGLTADEMADFNPALLEANTFNDEPHGGEVLAFPHQNSAQVLVVNQDMLTELGYDAPPATLEEFKEIACAAAELTGPNGEDIQGFAVTDDASVFETLVAAQGSSIYHDGAFDFTSDAAIATFQLYQDLYAEGCGYLPSEDFGNTADFALGLSPMATTSTAGFTFILGDRESAGQTFEMAVAPLPSTEGNQTVQIFVPSIIMVPSTPEQQLASWLFLKFLVSPESAARWSGNTGYFNPVLSTGETLTEETFANTALFPYFSAANELQSNADINTYVSPPVASYGAVRGLISEALAAVTTNGEDVATVAQNLQEQADAALAGE